MVKKIMAIILSVMSVGATVYGRNDSNRIRGSIQNTQDQVNVNVLGQLGMAFGNPGYANLLGRIGHLRRMNRDELVRIFETEFRNIIVRDANTIDQIDMRLFGNLLFRLFEYNFDMLGDAPHFISLLWMGGICIYLTEGDEGIEAMKRDLRDGDGREITVEELKDYLIRKIERIAMID